MAVELFAKAGGAFPSGAGIQYCCLFVIVPPVLVFAGVAILRNRAWPAYVALLLAGLPYLQMLQWVAEAQPSDDWEEMDEQAAARNALVFHGLLTAVAALPLVYFAGRRLVQWRRRLRIRHCTRPGANVV